MITVKNYHQGVSGMIHTAIDKRFEVKGPMGKGLQVKPTGVHIAFAAGTGVLCFIDLVAALVRQSLGIDVSHIKKDELEVEGSAQSPMTTETDGQVERFSVIDGAFKLFLYVSFPNRDDSIALELCEALANYCNREGKN